MTKIPNDCARALGKLFSKLDEEDKDTLNWLLAAHLEANRARLSLLPTRMCPNVDCGLVVTKIMVEEARFDSECPRCKKRWLSEFIRVDLAPNYNF